MKYHIITFGCQMNHSDSERIATVLKLAGLSPAPDINNADLLIINSCSVRQSAINRIFGLMNNLKKKRKLRSCRPKRNSAGRSEGSGSLGREQKILFPTTTHNFQNDNFKQLKTILTGCVLDADKKKFADKFDLIIDIKELTQKPKNLIDFLRLQDQEFKAFDYTDYFKINPQYRSKFSAYVPIMTGCNNYCAYCAVPYTRGREISRPAEEVINEVRMLVEKGYKEITLLGQNVNSYTSQMTNDEFQISNQRRISNIKKDARKDEIPNTKYRIPDKTDSIINSKIKKINFPQLLKQINDIPGDFWIRFLTSHPKDMSDALIRTMVKCEKVTEYVHLPIQSGNNEILNRMNRHYTQEQYLELIEKIKKAYLRCHCEETSRATKQSRRLCNKHGIATRSACWRIARNDKSDVWQPPVSISTDIIVGFPGETKKQFQNTAKLMRKVKFDMAYLSEYSPRTGTAAAKLKDSLTIAEKKQRKEFLNEILRKTALANNKKYIGKTVDVLIEKNDTDFFYGKTRTFKNVKIATKSILKCHSEQSEESLANARQNRTYVRDSSTPLHSAQNDSVRPGQFALIKITQAGAWGLEGQIV